MDSLLEQLRLISGKYETQVQTIMKKHKTTIAEYRLIVLVLNGIDTQDQIAQKTGLDTSTLSRQLKNGVTKEMLEKVSTGNDKRQLIYTVTEQGKKATKIVQDEIHKLNQTISKDWSDKEVKAFSDILEKLESSI